MSEESIIKHCSPTLAGLKTGNLFTHHYPDRDNMSRAIREWNKKLKGKGIRVIPLHYSEGNALIYMYRPAMLRKDMDDKDVCCFLEKCGYSAENCNTCIVRLVQRLAEGGDFPHEIGLFLGYPPEDVDGFIKNQAGGFKYVGYWKVYGDREKAEKTFSRYRKCTETYYDQWSRGKTIERLAVSV